MMSTVLIEDLCCGLGKILQNSTLRRRVSPLSIKDALAIIATDVAGECGTLQGY